MSVYTVLHIHPIKEIVLSDRFLLAVLNQMGASRLDIASGENRESVFVRMRKRWFPRLVEKIGGKQVFWETRIDIDRGIELWQTRKADQVHFSLGNEGWSATANSESEMMIAPSLANDFVPWDCGITIGPWQAHDYNEGNVIATGSFCIVKSCNGCPLILADYEQAFSDLPSVSSFIAFLEAQTGSQWKVTCALT